MNVLIVDDEPLARERLSRLVGELDGYRVLEPSASNGEEALALIESLRPDVACKWLPSCAKAMRRRR